ncbi:CIR protein [Plasmodium chabaudi adami]|uniref:CIR protein n=1 Tax=Plasmodium chabaudi adami TaxID=5826 RepID=A0A1C6WFZ9_PLACE|nr:CIR protein [Plasmodium chabaudi adami]
MSKEVCIHIHKIDNLIKVKNTDKGVEIDDASGLKRYCPNNINGEKKKNGEDGHCVNYVEAISSAFMLLLKYFEVVDDLKDEKYAEYAILWLSYKIQQYRNIEITTLKDFITKNIETNAFYNEKIKQNKDNKTYKEFIDIKQNLMNMDAKIIYKFYEALQILCNMYNENNEKNIDCTKCSQIASGFVEKYNELNGDPNVTKDSPYYQVWSTLSTDYNNFISDCIKNSNECSELPTLPEIKEPKKSVQDYAKLPAQGSESTSSISSIAIKLVPGLMIFAIPIFLGIAYKHSLFGIDKIFQRRYLREKLKKIKNKVNLNI